MSILFKALLVALICMPIFMPLASAESVAPVPVDDSEATALLQLEAQTGQEVEDIQGGLSQAWAIVGVVLVSLILLGIIL